MIIRAVFITIICCILYLWTHPAVKHWTHFCVQLLQNDNSCSVTGENQTFNFGLCSVWTTGLIWDIWSCCSWGDHCILLMPMPLYSSCFKDCMKCHNILVRGWIFYTFTFTSVCFGSGAPCGQSSNSLFCWNYIWHCRYLHTSTLQLSNNKDQWTEITNFVANGPMRSFQQLSNSCFYQIFSIIKPRC